MKTKNRSRTLFSALLARISKKFQTFPENKERIVKVVENGSLREIGSNERDAKMDEKNVAENVVAVEAPVVVDGPQRVCTRKGKKGPGSTVVIVPNLADAEIVKAEISKTVAADTMVFTAPYEAPVITSATDWFKAGEVIEARKAARAKAIAAIDPEILKLLGVKA